MFNSNLFKSYKESSYNESLNIKNDLDKLYNCRIYSDDFLYYKPYEIDRIIYIKLHKYSNEIEGYYDGILFYKYLLLKKRTYYQISYSPKIITKYKNNKNIYSTINKYRYINYKLYYDKYFYNKEVYYKYIKASNNIKMIKYDNKQTINFNYIQDNILITKYGTTNYDKYMRNFKIIVLFV